MPALQFGGVPSSSPVPVASPTGSATGRPYTGDPEQLLAEIRSYKEQALAAKTENGFLKAQMQRLIITLRKKDKQIDQITELKYSSCSDNGSDAILQGQLRELRSELSTIARLQDKYRDIESTLLRKEDELRRTKTTLKATNVTELESERETYFNESVRLRRGLLTMQSQIAVQSNQLAQLQHQCMVQQQTIDEQAEELQQRADGEPSARKSARNGTDGDKDELTRLKSENDRLRKEAAAAAAAAAAAKPQSAASPSSTSRTPRTPLASSSSLHVLHSLTQLQQELTAAVAREGLELTTEAQRNSAAWAEEDSAEMADYEAQTPHGDPKASRSVGHDDRHGNKQK
jgi:hypothetical protein